MEIKMKRKLLSVAMTALLLSPFALSAQTKVHDEQKEKQWRSMEVGPWGFAPGAWYYIWHRNYSGAKWKSSWFGLRYDVSFDESASNVKTVMPWRILQEVEQNARLNKVNVEHARMDSIFRDESVKSVDRNADLVYVNYKDEFDKLQGFISESLEYALLKSKGALFDEVAETNRHNEILCDRIKYIHRTGYGYELENSKRQDSYENALKRMRDIADAAKRLAYIAKLKY